MKNLLSKVYDKNEEYLGILVGYYHPLFYSDVMMKEKHDFKLWDKNYPEWRRNPLIIVFYEKPHRNMTKKEVADTFNLTEDLVNDKLYEAATFEYKYMVMPYESVVIKSVY